MLTVNKKERKSIRVAYGKALAEVGRENKNVVVLDSDLAGSTQTAIFAKEFPDRWFDCGIAEADMTTTAVGLATVGKIPFISSFAVFATGRNYDQVRNGICYAGFNVKVVGTHGGITVGEDGATHQSLEDVSLMRGIPGMQVLVPSDCAEMNAAVKYAANHFGPVYIRVPRSNVPDVFEEGHKFDMTKAVVLKEGKDVTIIATGLCVNEALEAAKLLAADGIDAEVINIHTIKPLDKELVVASAKKTGKVVTVEEHSVIGGLGGAVAEALSEEAPTKMLRIGMMDKFGQSGPAKALIEYYGLDGKSIYEKVKAFL